MTFDPTNRPSRRRPGWLSGLLPRVGDSRLTHVSDLPPRMLNDIGLQQDLVDVFLRHRR